MQARFRKTLAAATRALVVAGEHPARAPRFADWTARLAADLAAGRQALAQAGEGEDSGRSATDLRGDARTVVLDDIRALCRLGKAIPEELGTAAAYWKVGHITQPAEQLLARGRQYLAFARAHQDILAGYGVTPAHLDTMAAHLATFAARGDAQTRAQAAQISAHALIPELTTRILKALRALSAIYTHEFATQPDRLAAWQSAARVHAPHRKRPATPPTPDALKSPLALPPGQPPILGFLPLPKVDLTEPLPRTPQKHSGPTSR